MKEASDVMMNGISKKLSAHWGDEVDGRIVMVATTDNTSVHYKLVQDEREVIPAFILTTVCNDTKELQYSPGTSFRKLTIPKPTSISETIQNGLGLASQWMVEVINLEQDNFNETTRMTINFVQVSPRGSNSSCEGSVDNLGNFQLCRPRSTNTTCLMNTYMEYVKNVEAGCDSCKTEGIDFTRIEFSNPKPVYGGFIHQVLTLNGYMLIPQCTDYSNGGCLKQDDQNVDFVREKFVELLRGVINLTSNVERCKEKKS